MEKEKFEEIVLKLKLERNKWLLFHELESIILSNGKGFYPDWKYLRFLISDDNKIFVRHGKIKPYGARLGSPLSVAGDYSYITFPRTDRGVPIENSSFYDEWFRQPQFGDVLRVTENLKTVYGESIITGVKGTFNSVIVELATPLKFPRTGKLSFYDPSFLSDRDNCIHSTIHEGIYMYFSSNPVKKMGKFGETHEVIKIKDIKEINLKVGKEYFNKTFKLE